MGALASSNIILFLAFVMPGFLSMHVYGLLHPIEKITLKDNILEAIAFSVANFAIMSWAIFMLIDAADFAAPSFEIYVLTLLVFFVAPVAWPVALHFGLRSLARSGIILQRYATAWDDVFLRREPYWVIVHVKDGRRLGGRYGGKSYATLGYYILDKALGARDHQGHATKKVSGREETDHRTGDRRWKQTNASFGVSLGPKPKLPAWPRLGLVVSPTGRGRPSMSFVGYV